MSGALYLTEDQPELAEYFDPGREVLTYTDRDDLLDKARYYLAHQEQAERIRRAGFAARAREHTWQHRFAELFAALGLRAASERGRRAPRQRPDLRAVGRASQSLPLRGAVRGRAGACWTSPAAAGFGLQMLRAGRRPRRSASTTTCGARDASDDSSRRDRWSGRRHAAAARRCERSTGGVVRDDRARARRARPGARDAPRAPARRPAGAVDAEPRVRSARAPHRQPIPRSRVHAPTSCASCWRDCFAQVQLLWPAARPRRYRYVPYLMLDRVPSPRALAWKCWCVCRTACRNRLALASAAARSIQARPTITSTWMPPTARTRLLAVAW